MSERYLFVKKFFMFVLFMSLSSFSVLAQGVDIYKLFAANYKIYGGIQNEVPNSTPIAKVTFSKDKTFKWVMQDNIFQGSYSIDINANNRSEYILVLNYTTGAKEVLNIKPVEESVVPGVKNNVKKESYITSNPIINPDNTRVNLIFIR